MDSTESLTSRTVRNVANSASDTADNVVTSSLVMEGQGRVGDYVGGYSDWQRQRPTPVVAGAAPKLTPQVAREPAPAPVAPAKRKLGFKEQRELEQLPALIETLEAQVAAESLRIASPELYRQGNAEVQAANRLLAELQGKLESAYARWNELD